MSEVLNLEPLVEALAQAVADRVAAILNDRDEGQGSPWLTTEEAIDWSRLPAGTFRKLVADGSIPHHGGRTHTFHKAELDAALGYGAADRGATLRRVS